MMSSLDCCCGANNADTAIRRREGALRLVAVSRLRMFVKRLEEVCFGAATNVTSVFADALSVTYIMIAADMF